MKYEGPNIVINKTAKHKIWFFFPFSSFTQAIENEILIDNPYW